MKSLTIELPDDLVGTRVSAGVIELVRIRETRKENNRLAIEKGKLTFKEATERREDLEDALLVMSIVESALWRTERANPPRVEDAVAPRRAS